MKTVILRLQGTQSWGDSSKGVHRETRSDPTFSGVVGLLGSAMNLHTPKEQEIFNKLIMAVRVDKEGKKEVDYQNARGFCTLSSGATHEAATESNTADVQIWKYYLVDADFSVALTGDDDLITRIVEALKHPYYHLSLGRLASPPHTPIVPTVVETDNPINALIIDAKSEGFDEQAKPIKQKKSGITRFVVPSNSEHDAVMDVPNGRTFSTRYVENQWIEL